VAEGLRQALREDREVARLAPALEAAVRAGKVTPAAAAERLLAAFRGDADPDPATGSGP
jgi:hypothetical protein